MHHPRSSLLTTSLRHLAAPRSCFANLRITNDLLLRGRPLTLEERLEEQVTRRRADGGLRKEPCHREHGETAVVQLLGLVVHPALVRVVRPFAGAEQVSGLVVGTLLREDADHLDDRRSRNNLDPAERRHGLHGHEGVVGHGSAFIERVVHALHEVAEGAEHRQAAVLQLRFPGKTRPHHQRFPRPSCPQRATHL
eukprot:scaffold145_cov261-Pinguiococcus_pyrenoidosus.AAC.9